MTKRKFFAQGAALTAVTLLLRLLGMGYRAWLSQRMGPAGMGLYQLILSVFLLTVTLSTSGVSLAVTRLVAQDLVQERRDRMPSTVLRCLAYCLSVSLGISLLLFAAAGPAARLFLSAPEAAACLRVLGLGLPLMALSTCMKGYFLAVDQSLSTAFADTAEQLLTVGVTLWLFFRFPPQSIAQGCLLAVWASTLGELCSCLVNALLCRRSLRLAAPKPHSRRAGVLQGMLHIALPCTLSAAARSALSTGENLLIPRQLRLYGLGYDASLAQYGLLQGMAMPVLCFPAAFITGFASLLIPKITLERERGHRRAVAYISGRAVSAALAFGAFFAALFMAFGGDWSLAFYRREDAGVFLRVLSPLAPLIYLDVVVDCLLKGMDEQLASMKVNLADAALRVLLVFLLLPRFGLESYLFVLFFSTIFNGALSLHRLVRATGLRLSPLRQLLAPAAWAAVSVLAGKWLLSRAALPGRFLPILAQTLVCGALFAAGWLQLTRPAHPSAKARRFISF